MSPSLWLSQPITLLKMRQMKQTNRKTSKDGAHCALLLAQGALLTLEDLHHGVKTMSRTISPKSIHQVGHKD